MLGIAALDQVQEIANIAPADLAFYFANSGLAGLILSVVTIWAIGRLPSVPETFESEQQKTLAVLETRVNAFTVLFLCIGMTGVMVLVSNSLARAFAVGAAISLVRFRIRLDKPGLSTALFFAVLVGMSCGVGYIVMAWIVTGAFAFIQLSLVALSGRWLRNEMPVERSEAIDDEIDEAPLVVPHPSPSKGTSVPAVVES